MPGTGRRDREEGISVIIGTLLLILITVTAAAGLAVMVSQMQKDEMNRQTHQAQVKNEELKITGIDLVFDANASTWSAANITILNLNLDDSAIIALGVNNRYASSVTDLTGGTNISYNLLNKERLQVDAAKQKIAGLNFTTDFASHQAIGVGEPITVKVMTSLFNNFEHTFIPPAAMFKMSIETEDLGVTERDVILADGSESYDDGTIVSWNWTLNITGYPPQYYSGKTVRISPNAEGPFQLWLTVTDDTGMIGISKKLDIPRNPRMSPPAYLDAWQDSPNGTRVAAKITGIDGQGVSGVLVTFTRTTGDLNLTPLQVITDSNGFVSTGYITNETGVVRVISGKLPPKDVIVS